MLLHSCKDCIISYLVICTDKGEQPRCPTCSQGPVKEQDLIEVFRPRPGECSPQGAPTGNERGDTSTEVFLRRNDFRSSTKLDALVQNLRRYHFMQYIPFRAQSEVQVDFEIKTHTSAQLSSHSSHLSFPLSLSHWTVNACRGIGLMGQWTSRSAVPPYQSSSRTNGSRRCSLSA